MRNIISQDMVCLLSNDTLFWHCTRKNRWNAMIARAELVRRIKAGQVDNMCFETVERLGLAA